MSLGGALLAQGIAPSRSSKWNSSDSEFLDGVSGLADAVRAVVRRVGEDVIQLVRDHPGHRASERHLLAPPLDDTPVLSE